ncbi:mitochondrial ribonuclease P protein 1 homolog [Thrips palmi]|uniref:RNA (guanine-9-)-methyltransferase domain-containing protein 1 n=1 Tax=Thrips palmi TaxID=161013 RepID=A0A6P9A5H2_THRPL|nr:mitochondrial ribonuclease P protein 1 homolog [Thrips palmi]
MWFALRRIVNVGANQLTSFSKLSCCCGIRSKTCASLEKQNWLSTQAPMHLQDMSNHGNQGNSTSCQKVKLNPEIDDRPYKLSKEQEEFLTQGSAENRLKLDEFLLQLQTFRETGTELPDVVKLEDLCNMLPLAYVKRLRYLTYLMKIEYKSKMQVQRKAAKQISRSQKIEKKQELESKLEHPWLEHSNLMMPIHKGQMNHFYNSNSLAGLLYGQKVVIDCSYNSYMNDLSIKLTAKQILFCFYSSRKNRRPFSLYICNLDYDSRLMYYLKKLHPGVLDVPISFHSKSYTELFDRKKIVYLTPHSYTVLNYNPEDIYIIGGFVDKQQLEVSRSKAENEHLRFASLPLDNYLKWKSGSRSLCLHQCLDILLEVKNTGDWSKALQAHVPSRKIKPL